MPGSRLHGRVLYPGVQIVLGNVSETADYVTNEIPAGSNSKVTLTYEALIIGTVDVQTYAQKTDKIWQLV